MDGENGTIRCYELMEWIHVVGVQGRLV
jgi:hypothetical protein